MRFRFNRLWKKKGKKKKIDKLKLNIIPINYSQGI